MGLKKQKVIISNKARKSIREIFDEIKDREKSLSIAHYVRDGIIEKCLELKNFSGYSQEDFLKDLPGAYRSVSKWNYLIIFTVSEDEVRVLNVIHTGKHPDARKDID
jgi:plasmid stabilization system protein ParE